MFTILGAGLSGLSVADHLRKNNVPFTLFEAKSHGGGHIYSEKVDGFVWDEGPHVSFTRYDYVKAYFAGNCDAAFLEYPTNPSNYYEGNWIPHPAQSNMYAIPAPLRDKCLSDVALIREQIPASYQPENYQEWIDYAFGETFAQKFPNAYTIKYWTTEPANLTTDWIGKRIYFPEISDMVDSANGPLQKQTHYITKVRYPESGGYYSFIKKVEEGLPVQYNYRLKHISFDRKELEFENGSKLKYQKLINTLPLPQLILNSDAPEHIKVEAEKLKCSQVLIINVIADHPALIQNHWIYVYDQNLYSTRINFTELLSPNNGEEGKTGIQVEVYFSDYHQLNESIAYIENAVLNELVEMKLLLSRDNVQSYHSKWLDWANVIFDNKRIEAQNNVLDWLCTKGMVREADDLEPMTDWDTKPAVVLGDIILAGRFAQWKYYWTDDCVMRALYIAGNI